MWRLAQAWKDIRVQLLTQWPAVPPFPICYAICMRNHRIIIGNVAAGASVERHSCSVVWVKCIDLVSLDTMRHMCIAMLTKLQVGESSGGCLCPLCLVWVKYIDLVSLVSIHAGPVYPVCNASRRGFKYLQLLTQWRGTS